MEVSLVWTFQASQKWCCLKLAKRRKNVSVILPSKFFLGLKQIIVEVEKKKRHPKFFQKKNTPLNNVAQKGLQVTEYTPWN